MNDTLYIIGNGFDRYHGIQSDCWDFGRYLERVDHETYREVETYFTINDDFWWEFEARLAYFDVETVVDYASQFLISYGADDWSDSGHHDYQYELNRVVETISSTMRTRFAEWIRQLDVPTAETFAGKLLPLDPDARYLNFNYTTTLQRIYGIADRQILHIHGRADSPTDQLVLGHGWLPKPADSLNHGLDLEELDTRIFEGNRIVDSYFAATFKPSYNIIERQQPFFQNLKSVFQIFVLGHSLSEVDAPYLEEIIKNTEDTAVSWKISYHSDPLIAQARMSALGIDSALTTFVRLAEL